ncbi:MAG TPA: cellulase family glycosylhydrolase [Candidatus Dormibacteraeota bacterium]|nr:cellulase family glycosylhydrolase [Candidatus Dormibacteraeota bacterium]
MDRRVLIQRVLLVALAVLVALFTYPGAMVASFATRITPPPTSSRGPAGALSWLHVEHPSGAIPYIADDEARMVFLHGATPASLLEFGPRNQPEYPIDPAAYENGQCPANKAESKYPPLCEADVAQMARLGFNVIRLPISWSLLEPQRGQFSRTYIDRVAQIVDWARAEGIYVIVDMHQNAYSNFVGASDSSVDLGQYSGAPAWATFTDGLPSHVFVKQREVNPAVLEATTNFWYDRNGIQDEYLAALAHIARRFRDDPVVAGYGVYNEPLIGWGLPPGFEDLLLFPFYRRAIDAITGAHDGLPCWSGFFMPAVCGYRNLGAGDARHLIFLDTGLLREVTDFPTHLSMPLSSYPNTVLALHAYTHFYTVDHLLPQLVSSTTYPWGGYDQSYSLGEHEARAMGAALFVSEFGSPPDDDSRLLASQVVEQERHRTGFAFWTWKENGGSGAWGIYASPKNAADPNGCLRSDREQLLARIYPRATADTNLVFRYDSGNGSFSLDAVGDVGDAATVVYVPPEVTGDVTVTGAASTIVDQGADGSRLVTTSPTGGAFGVQVAAATLNLTGCD